MCTAFLWPLCFDRLFVLSPYKEDYLQILNVRPFEYIIFFISIWSLYYCASIWNKLLKHSTQTT